jgi:tetratricopeptide (TPR) repeat protein
MDAKRSIPLALAVLLFAVSSFVRSAVYQTEVTLYSDIVAKSPDKARPHNNLGHALKEEHRIPEAQIQLEQALALKPDYPDALNNLGTIYSSIGRRQEGHALLERALQIDPGHVQARYNMAMQYYENGMIPEAEREYQLLIRLAPQSKEAGFAYKMLALINGNRR